MADTYYFPNSKTILSVSPYLSDSDIPEIPPATHSFVENLLPGLYDEETHALLHIDPYLDLLMQSQPLTYAFTDSSPMFNAPDRFVHPKPSLSRMDGFGITQHRFDVNGNLIETRSDSPVDYVSKSLAKQLRQLHMNGHRVYTPELPDRSMISSTKGFDAPWWTTDSIYETEEQVAVLPVYRSSVSFITNDPVAQKSDISYISSVVMPANAQKTGSKMQCEIGTQYESSSLPRILIDAITGTDEMERDIRHSAVSDFVDQMIESLTISTVSDATGKTTGVTNTDIEKTDEHPVDNAISCVIDKSLDMLKTPEHEYDFVHSAEVVE